MTPKMKNKMYWLFEKLANKICVPVIETFMESHARQGNTT